MSFEWYECIKRIINNLKAAGYIEFSEQVHDRQLSGAVSSEILMAVGSKLLDIKLGDSNAYNIIRTDSESLIQFSNSIGLFPRPTNFSF